MMSSSNGFFESINPWSWGAKTRASGTDDTFSDAAKLYPDLWGELFTGSNVICCPISGSLADSMTKDLLMSHILIPQRVGGEFKTILGEHVYMSGNQLLCGAGFLEQREVNIISVDEITDSSGKVATMLRINRPLVGGIVALDDAEEISLRAMFKYMAVLRSFPEAESSFIVLDDYIKEINYVGSKSVDGFSRIQPSLAVSLQLQWERATEKLCRINALVSALGGGFDNTKRMIGQILESYLMYAVSGTVYPWMCSLLALDDKRLYEYLETLQHYTQSDLGIPPALQCCQIEAVTELRTLRCAETPVDKLLVLKRAVKFIRTRIDRNVKSKFPQDDVELATDDIVLLIIWCLLQLHLSESLINPESVLQAMNGGGNVGKEIIRTFLVSELEFMSKYHFNGSSKSELGFTLCHFQVAVDWIITRSQAFAQRKRIRSIRSPEMINLSSVVQDLKIDMSAAAKPTVDQALKIDLSSIANSVVDEDSKIDLSGAANPNIDEDLSIDLSAATNPIVDEDSKIDQSAIAKLSFDSDMQADVPVVSKSGKVTDRINNIEKKEFMRVGDRFNPGSPVSHPGSCPASSVPSRPVESRYVNLRKVIEKKAEQAKEKDSLTGPNIVEKDKSVRGSIGEKEKNMRGIARDNGMKGIFRDNSMKGIVRDNSQKAMIEKKSNIVKDNDIIDALQGSLEVVGEKKEETLEMQKLGLEYLHGLCVTATEMNLDWITRINKNQRAVRQKAVGSVEYKMPYSFTAFSSPCVSTSSMKSVIDDESLKVNTENDLNVNLNFCFSSTSENNKVAKGFEKKGRVLLILGDDHTHHPEILKKKITIISDRTNKPGEILSVSGAVGVFAAVNSDGRVFTWGIPDSGRLGRGPGGEFDEIVPTLNPTSVDGGGLTGSRVIQIACGKSHMAAVTDVGELFTWGDNRCSQLGLSSSSTISFDSSFELVSYIPPLPPPAESSFSFYGVSAFSTTPTPTATTTTTTTAPPLVKTQYLSTFSNQNSTNSIHPSLSVPLISYTIPLSSKVATDLESFSSCGPVLIHHLRDVKIAAVACGAHHTLCLSDDGKVYSWGRGANGRLGQYADSLDIPDCTVGSATLVKTHNNWIAEEFELFHSSSSSSSSSSFSSRCPTHRAPTEITPAEDNKPECTDDSHPKQSIVTNDDYFSFASIYASAIPTTNSFTDKNVAAPSTTSNIVTSDSDTEGKGTSTSAVTVSKSHKFSTPTKQIDTNRHPGEGLTPIGTPSLPPSLLFPNKIICISAGLAHSLAVTACGTVFTWGCGTNGRLGHGSHCDEFYPRQVQVLTMSGIAVTSVSAGAAHSVFLSHSGLLFGCGLNSRGQVGCISNPAERNGEGINGLVKDKHDRDSILCPQPIDVSTEKFLGYLPRSISSKSDRGRGRGRGSGISGDEESKSKSDLRLISMTVASVGCGNYHTAAITHTGRLLIWGACNVTTAAPSTIKSGSPTRVNISNNGSGSASVRRGNRSPKGNFSPTAAFSNALSIDCSPSVSTSHLDKHDVTSGLGGVPLQVKDG